MVRPPQWILTAIVLLAAAAVSGASAQPRIRIEVDHTRIGMGRSVEVDARAVDADGRPLAGYLLFPFVNGKRWGAEEYTDAEGRAVMLLPLPNPGTATIAVAGQAQVRDVEKWIWARQTEDHQTVYFEGTFKAPAAIRAATFWLAADDAATAFLNGSRIAAAHNWRDTPPITNFSKLIKPGDNTFCVQATNGVGPAGLLARLEMETADGRQVVGTDASWRVFAAQPPNWPQPSPGGEGANEIGTPDTALWANMMPDWPTLKNRISRMAGDPIPAGVIRSNQVAVAVERRRLQPPPSDPKHLIGIQWEPWFTPQNCNWSTAQAIPLMGRYWSTDPDITRQQMIWIAESGADFLVVDWTNQLWGKQHFAERTAGADAIMDSTTRALETLASMRDEGLPVPKMVIYLGVNNGPSTTMVAINEEMDWIHRHYILNPRFKGLFVDYLGKPLLLIHNGAGPHWLTATHQVPVDDSHFTIRFQSSQHQTNDHAAAGYWTWMDGSLEPVLTRFHGEPEELTPSVAFFAGGGWTGKDAYGRRGGWTYMETFKSALKYRPRFLELHQYQEFAGQMEGAGYGPNHDRYVDTYSVELSDDIEPTSLTAPGYRGNGGWGFLYLNLTRALVDLYRQPTPVTTVAVVSQPLRREVVTADKLDVAWNWIGKAPRSFSISINGVPVAKNLQGTKATVDLAGVRDGPVKLRLTADGTESRYLLSYTEDSLPLAHPVPAYAEIEFTLHRKR